MKRNGASTTLFLISMLVLAAFSVNLPGAGLYSPQIVVGSQGDLFAKTEIGLMNRTNRPLPVRIRFLRNLGLPFQVKLIVLPAGDSLEASEFQVELPPNGTWNATVVNCSNFWGPCLGNMLQNGYAHFEVEDVNHLEIETVFVNLSHHTGKTTAAVGVPARQAIRSGFFNVRLSDEYHWSTGQRIGIDSGLAIANPNPTIVVLEMNLLNPDGSSYASKLVELRPGEHLSRFITELFPGVLSSTGVDKVGFRVSFQATFPVAVLALRADRSDSFLISGVPVFENE